MSRHRAVRNLDLDAELAEEYSDEGDYLDDLSPEDQEAMEQSLHDLQDELGGANLFSERQMREALYETYFDVSEAIAFLVQEREREEALAKKKAAPTPSAPLTASQPKLSKLQQKMQAARLKGKPAKTTGTGAQAPAAATQSMQSTPTPSRPSTPSSPAPAAAAAPPVATVPSGESIARLFPAPAPAHGAPSPFVQLLERPVSKSAHPLPSVSVSEDEMQNLRQVFSTLSPDDIVLQARRGTRLAQ